MKTKRFGFFCVLLLLFSGCGSQRENEHSSVINSAIDYGDPGPEGRYIYTTKSSLGQPIIRNGQPFRARDVIKRAKGREDIIIRSGNLEDLGAKEYALAKCSFKKMDLTLPRSRNGVYWGQWTNANDTLDAVTYTWSRIGSRNVAYTIINERYVGMAEKPCGSGKFSAFLISMYHEVVGHNINNANHEDDASAAAFDLKYEDPVFAGLHKYGTCKIFDACVAEGRR